MADHSINDLLHTVVKNLHSLSTFIGRDDDYEDLLKRTISQVLQLLNFGSEEPFLLQLSVKNSQIGDLDLMCYSRHNGINNLNIFNHISSNDIMSLVASYSPEDNGVLNQLVSLLASTSWADEKHPLKLKDRYNIIILKLSHLVQFFIRFHNQAELKLHQYLTNCMVYESRFYSNLQNKLDMEMNLNDQDTQQLAEFLDSVVASYHLNTADDNDSIFSYENDTSQSDIQLGFHSNNSDFKLIYNLFLQIVARKNVMIEVDKYVRILINVFKKHANIDYFEVNEFLFKETKLKCIVDFFIGENSSILPHKFRIINEQVLGDADLLSRTTNIELEQKQSRQLPNDHQLDRSKEVPSYTPTDSAVPVILCSREDQVKLFQTLIHIVPLLNEFDLNFDPKFPFLFRYYLKLLYDVLPSSSGSEDLMFVNDIIRTVNMIVDFENEEDNLNFDIRQVVFDFNDLHLKLTNRENPNSSILMRYANFQFYDDFKLCQLVIRRWQTRLNNVHILQSTLRTWNSKRAFLTKSASLKKWFDQNQRIKNIELETMSYYQTHLKYKFFCKWNSNTLKVFDLNLKSGYICTLKFWNIWHSKFQEIRDLESRADEFCLYSSKKDTLQLYMMKYQNLLSLQHKSENILKTNTMKQDELLKEFYWNKLFYRMDVKPFEDASVPLLKLNTIVNLTEKLAKLRLIETQFVKEKHFKKWKKMTHLSKLINKAQKENNLKLLQCILNDLWMKKYTLVYHSNELIVSRHKKLRQKIFEMWVEQLEHRTLADSVYTKNLLRHALKRWKIELTEVKFKHTIPSIVLDDYSVLKSYWNKIYLRSLSSHFLHVSGKTKASIAFKEWIHKYQHVSEMDTKSEEFYSKSTMSRGLLKWVDNVNDVNEMAHTADLNIQRKYFNHLNRMHFLYSRQLKSLAEKMMTNNFRDKITKKFALRIWNDRYRVWFEESANSKIENFNLNYVSSNLLSQKFRQWVKKYNKEQTRKLQLEEMCNEYLKVSVTKKFMFNLWNQRIKQFEKTCMEADMFETNVLTKKLLIVWFDQCFNRVAQLNEKADLYIAKKEIRKLEEIVNTWSMKIINKMKRNQESCDLFMDRWQNLKLKAIFGLWILRCKERLDQLYEYDVSDISHMSNSPLAQRVQRLRRSNENDSSYLSTPIKEQVSMSNIFTPGPSRPSPTKLQETTQRLKYERTDALRRYLQRAKGPTTSTPARKPNPSTVTRISPPKLKSLMENHIELLPPKPRSYTNMIPPNPPNFYLNRSSVSPDSDDTLRITKAENSDSEAATVDSAKRLRKITPIIFPTEEDVNLPKFSPVGKLKERLRNNLQNTVPKHESSGIFD